MKPKPFAKAPKSEPEPLTQQEYHGAEVGE